MPIRKSGLHAAEPARWLWRVALALAGVALVAGPAPASRPGIALPPQDATTTVVARVVAMDQPFMWNRLGAAQPNGVIFALEGDVVPLDTQIDEFGNDVVGVAGPGALRAGSVRLRSSKRPRPLVLRVNRGEYLEIHFTNLLAPQPKNSMQVATRTVGAHVEGLEMAAVTLPDGSLQAGIASDASWVGENPRSIATPGESRIYRYYAAEEGTFMMHSGAGWMGDLRRVEGGLVGSGLFGAVIVEPEGAEYYRSQVTRVDLAAATTGRAPTGQPLIDYQAVFASGPRGGMPVLRMTRPLQQGRRELVYGDLTALITGPGGGRFPADHPSAAFRPNPMYPDRHRPYREIAVFYHEFLAVQAFPQFYDPQLFLTLLTVQDNFAINYGMAGIGAEVIANRLGVGPMGRADAVDLRFEEFFLSAWAVGDPAMVVDVPANAPSQVIASPAAGGQTTTDQLTPPVFAPTVAPGPKATKAFYPDDPSNVYHSYLGDPVKYRVLHTGQGITHVHHQHAHQWLHSPASDNSTYLDSQLLSPGSTYTLDIVRGSGNENLTVGDALFHCHFYVHFATGMWATWRVHDVFEEGTRLDDYGRPLVGIDANGDAIWNRALPDGEIVTGTPIPALVPLPTLAMAPMPADVRLVDEGRRVEVRPTVAADGTVSYENPGFPFFVPGVAGHRAPHPPMDFAWEENADGTPTLDADGNRIPLDGGLPRHLILDGKIVREAHTRWDFSKDYIRYDDAGNVVDGGLVAFELPDAGTAVEAAAMAAHARGEHDSFTPEGEAGIFRTSGRPPVPGGPFADPGLRTEENVVRRYKAAVVQTNAVLSKTGWHQPQTRFLTLWEDVSPTVTGQRPPQPLFMRTNSGDTIEFWHSNLVPSYFDLDDFVVRTPTDILGQHIHLVKYDLLGSDGATNGFNYEDGTFSPDEVRARIDAINYLGGLYSFDPLTQHMDPSDARRRRLAAKPAPAVFGSPPAGQDWTGAQTTVQLWDGDPVYNLEGEDRTMRTIFTHDHFSASTHQAAGLYAAILTEPTGSRWVDPVTGEDLNTRDDGGPTSWQANILTPEPADSYREFAVILQDSQPAYTSGAAQSQSAPTSALFYSGTDGAPELDALRVPGTLRRDFSRAGLPLAVDVDVVVEEPGTRWSLTVTEGVNEGDAYGVRRQTLFEFDDTNGAAAEALDAAEVSEALRFAFNRSGGVELSSAALVAVQAAGSTWSVAQPLDWLTGGGEQTFGVVKDDDRLRIEALKVYVPMPPSSWSSYGDALNAPFDPPNWVNGPPFPAVVHTFPIPGAYSVNYRAEPIALRVAGNAGAAGADPRALDLAYAFASIRRADPALNRQPGPGEPIDSSRPDGFRFPIEQLAPVGPTGARPTDPYTPLMRAYAGDSVQVRALMGANHSPQFFGIQGVKWLYEAAWADSGFRNTQGLSVSEHFEFLFRLPAASTTSERPFADYLYRAAMGTGGIVGGAWGLLRAYDGAREEMPDLVSLPNNPDGSAGWDGSLESLIPPDAEVREFHVVATTAAQALPDGRLVYNDRGQVVGLDPARLDARLSIENPEALLYVRADDLDDDGRLKEGVPIEPLILRAAAGEWLRVTLSNRIDPNLPRTSTSSFLPFSGTPPGQPYSGADEQITFRASLEVGLNPQLIAHEVTASGLNVGFNPTSTVVPEAVDPERSSVTYTWYAGDLSWDASAGAVVETPIEFGTTVLAPAEPLVQHRKGLMAALIIEPAGSTWVEDADSRASATVTPVDGEPFREFVLLMSDDATLYSGEPLFSIDAAHEEPLAQRQFTFELQQAFEANGFELAPSTRVSIEEAGRSWLLIDLSTVFGVLKRQGRLDVFTTHIEAVNYGTEPFSARYPLRRDGFDTARVDMTRVFSNQQVGGDPKTPIFVAEAGSPVRFRLAHPDGVRPVRPNGVVFVVHGHNWQELPFVDDSTRLGDNPLSRWVAYRGRHGPLDHYDILLRSAGGTEEVPGDYLYGNFPSDLVLGGSWGILRVVPKGSGTSGAPSR